MNRNIVNLARLYDCISKELHDIVNTSGISFNDTRIKDKVAWLGEITKTLSLVYQIESMRVKTGNKDTVVNLPAEENVIDTGLKKSITGKLNVVPYTTGGDQNNPGDLPHFPGGWRP